MKNSGKKNQIKQTNKKQPTSKGHTTYGEGSYFNPYATHMPVQSRTRSTYKTNTTMQKVDDNRKKMLEAKLVVRVLPLIEIKPRQKGKNLLMLEEETGGINNHIQIHTVLPHIRIKIQHLI